MARKTVQWVLVVEDHPMVREGLRACFSNCPSLKIWHETDNVADALNAIKLKKPDLAIVDLSLKETCGLELVKSLHRLSPHTKIIIYSMYDGSLYAQRSLQAGAHAYVNKQADPGEILEAVHQVLAGNFYLNQGTCQQLLKRRVQSIESYVPEVDVLSDRELEVFRQIGLGVPTTEIAYRLHVSRNTVDSHREKIKAKLGLPSGMALARHAFLWVMENG